MDGGDGDMWDRGFTLKAGLNNTKVLWCRVCDALMQWGKLQKNKTFVKCSRR